jgi:hypothetical protein
LDSKGEDSTVKNKITTRTILLFLTALSSAIAQEKKDVIYQTAGPVAIAGAAGMFGKPVQGAPYSATITNESTQTLADGNRIVQKSSGMTARDSQGRTRQDAALPAIGNLSAANAPELVFIQDPVAQVSYTLNVTERTAQKMMALFPPPGAPAGTGTVAVSAAGAPAGETFFAEVGTEASASEPVPPPPMTFHKRILINDPAEAKTEDLGSQMIEGVLANGVRTTRTIPAGQIGNEKALSIVTEVWTSPELKTVVYSKRTDPRMGEQIFHLTNIVRAEPDPALFTVPANFKIVEGPKPIIYRSAQ